MKNIYKNVIIGKNARIEEFVKIGCPPRGKKNGELKTVIGKDCHLRSGTVIYAGNVIGDNFSTGHNAVIREKNAIGDNVSIGTLSCIEHHVKIRDNVRIHSQVFVPEYSILEEAAWIGPNAVLTNAFHPQCPRVKECLKGPHIKRGAKIGANATILPAVVIGERALIGAGSVVSKNVPRGAVMCGNPAKVMKDISEIKCKYNRIDNPYGKGKVKK